MKKIIFLFILCVFYVHIFGQFRPKENCPTPTAASLGEYGQMSVNMFTGQPNVSIPLYEVKMGDLSLPISLDYNLASVKPNKRSGWVGLGWNLSAGGCITRNVRGFYDEKQTKNGHSVGLMDNERKLEDLENAERLAYHNKQYLALFNGKIPEPDEQGNVQLLDYYDLMADEYNFQFGKYSGSFYLSETGGWKFVSDYDIKVVEITFRTIHELRDSGEGKIDICYWNNKEWNRRLLDTFTLSTPDGVKYTFGGKDATEYSINYYNRNGTDLIPTSWFLTRIESPLGYEIYLDYEPGMPICEIQFSAFSSYLYTNCSNPGSLLSGQFLEPGGQVAYADNTQGRKRLSGYLMFPVYLKSIATFYVEVDFHSVREIPSNEDLYPDSKFLAWETDTKEQWTTPFSNSPYSPANQFHVFMPSPYLNDLQKNSLDWRVLRGITIATNYSIDTTYTKTYYLDYIKNSRRKLSRIAEREGDYVETYYYNSGIAKIYTIPDAKGYNPKEYSFQYNTDNVFGRYVYSSVDHWGYYNGGESSYDSHVLFDKDYYKSRNPSYNLNISKAETLKSIVYPTGGKTCFDYRQNQYSKIVPIDCEAELSNSSGEAGGLCVSAIRTYDENDKLVQHKKYYYCETIPQNDFYTNPSSGILKANPSYTRSYYAVIKGKTAKDDKEMVKVICSEGGFVAEGINQKGPHVGYSTVIEESVDSKNNSLGFIRYRYTNYDRDIWGETHRDRKYAFSCNVSGDSYYTPVSSKSMERGKIVSEEYFDNNRNLTKSVKYKYEKINVDSIIAPVQEYVIVDSNPYDFWSTMIGYMTYVYTHCYFVSNIYETYYNPENGQEMQCLEKAYTYNPQKLIASEAVKASDGSWHKTTYKYPTDYSNTAPYSKMVKERILTNVIEKTQYKDNDMLYKEITDYREIIKDYWGRKIFVPHYVRTQQKGQANPETRIVYHKHKLHPYIVTVDGVTTIYKWSHDEQYLNYVIENPPADVEYFLSYVNLDDDSEDDEDSFYDYYDFYSLDLSNTQVTIYTHIPGIGIKSCVKPNGLKLFYNYDRFGRLKEVFYYEDNDLNKKRKVEDYKYHYKD
ncbi:MAG: hypothetical protein LBI82_01010 [Dysgonamonadaceae bacterium]|jgi:hypothetical protein|nr:hypothetical protein [Dysgonamonadaceae bacterium]